MPNDEKEIKADLFTPEDLNNHMLANILDPGSWQKLITEYADGAGEPMNELLDKLVERK